MSHTYDAYLNSHYHTIRLKLCLSRNNILLQHKQKISKMTPCHRDTALQPKDIPLCVSPGITTPKVAFKAF